jgi:hypothetical protein
MPRKEKKPPRLSGTIKDLPLRDYNPDQETRVKGGTLKTAAATSEIVSPRDAASGLPTGKRT